MVNTRIFKSAEHPAPGRGPGHREDPRRPGLVRGAHPGRLHPLAGRTPARDRRGGGESGAIGNYYT
jgi:hypothetical protein